MEELIQRAKEIISRAVGKSGEILPKIIPNREVLYSRELKFPIINVTFYKEK
jgi:hypothetical protein